MKTIQRLVCAIALLPAGLAAACASALPLPWWLTENRNQSGELTLDQTVSFVQSDLEVCLTLTNVSAQDVIIGRVSHSQFLTFFFDERGETLRDDGRTVHPHYVPPPPPPAPGVVPRREVYELLAPSASATDCSRLSLPATQAPFRVISRYRPDLSADYVPTSVTAERRVVDHDYGGLLSNSCWVSVRDRTVRCEE